MLKLRKSFTTILWPILLFGLIAVVYILRLSSTVQIGDTGELATAAFKLYVPHPPGYPLWLWLNAAFVRLVDFSSIFWRVSLLNVLFSLGTLYFIWRLLSPQRILGTAVVLTLAFSRIFWRYSELPDVFILNALFASWILYLYFADDLKVSKKFWIPLIFSIGLTNHHTLIFLAPLVLDVLIEDKKYKTGIFATLLGIVVFAGLYASLMLLNTDSLFSWGDLSSFENLLGHILRKDYGTFKLVGSNEEGSAVTNWLYLGQQTFLIFYALIAATIIAGFKTGFVQAKSKKFFLVLLVLGLYGIGFFAMSNTPLVGFRYEITDRFMILFQILLCFLCAYVLQAFYRSEKKSILKPALSAILILSATFSFWHYESANDFSKNTIVEDYAMNLLRAAPSTPTVLFAHSDTRFFALRYTQEVLGIRPDVLVIGRQSLFFPWFVSKIQKSSSLKIDQNKILATNSLDLQGDLVLPNLDRFSFITTLPLPVSESYHQVILPVGRLLKTGKGLSGYDGSTDYLSLRSKGSDINAPKESYDVFREVWTEYSLYQLGQAQRELQSGNVATAQARLESHLQNTPWDFLAADGLCKLKNQMQQQASQNCEAAVTEIKRSYFDYY